MGKKKDRKKLEKGYPLKVLRMQAEDARIAHLKKLRRNEPPDDFKKDRAKRFVKSEDDRIAQERVNIVLAQIRERMDLESRAGRHHAIVYSFGASEFRPKNGMLSSQNHTYTVCSDAWLIGTARRVFEHCLQHELRPTIERWQGGPESPVSYGFNIVVHF
jgi:hypothetical protein